MPCRYLADALLPYARYGPGVYRASPLYCPSPFPAFPFALEGWLSLSLPPCVRLGLAGPWGLGGRGSGLRGLAGLGLGLPGLGLAGLGCRDSVAWLHNYPAVKIRVSTYGFPGSSYGIYMPDI